MADSFAEPSPPPLLDPAATSNEPRPFPPVLTIRDLKRNQAFAPGGERWPELASAYLPMVLGVAANTLAGTLENQGEAELAAESVFLLFSRRWKRLGRRTCLASWFWKASIFAAQSQLKAQKQKVSKTDRRFPAISLARHIDQLPSKLQNPFLWLNVLGWNPSLAAGVAITGERKLLKRAALAQKRVVTFARKKKIADSLAGAAQWIMAPSAELAGRINQIQSQPVAASAELSRLARLSTSRWRRHRFAQFVKRLARGIGATAAILGVIFGVFFYLATHGYLMEWGMRQQARDNARRFPGLAEPAKPWPVAGSESPFVQTAPPADSAALYSPAKIWTASLQFTPEQWKGIAPTRIEPVRNLFQGGRIALRNPKAKRSGLSAAVGIEFNWTEGALEFAGEKFQRVAVRYRGNGTYLNSQYGPKQSFKVDLNEFVKGQDLAGMKTLNFLNCIADDSYMRDVLAERLFADLGAVAPRPSYAYLTLDAPGTFDRQPLGLYVLMENIDAAFAESRFGSKKTPIFKPVTYELFSDLGDNWAAYEAIYDLKTKATPDQQQRIIDLARLTTHASDAEFAAKLPDFLDLQEFAAFVAGHVLLSSYDGFLSNGQNFYMYLDPKSNRFGFISWDQDHSWGEFGYMGTPQQRERASIWDPAVYSFRFLKRVMNVDAFKKVYRAKLEEGLQKYFSKDRLWAEVDELAAEIRPAVAAENGFRLERFDKAVSSTWPDDYGSGPAEGPGSPVQPIKRFIEKRIISVRNQLDGKEQGAQLSRAR
jgi:hypothetical protein